METYWEFLVEDPINWVHQTTPMLLSIGLSSGARSRAYPYGEAFRGVELNSYSVTIRLHHNVRLRVYAKTNKRVRFEIEHDFRKQAGPLRALGGHTAEDDQTLMVWLRAIRQDAANELNEVLSQLARVGFRSSLQHSVTQLMFRVSSACQNLEDAEQILSCIAINGYINPSSDQNLKNAVKILSKMGVLRRVAPRSSNFSVGPSYIDASQRLAAPLNRLAPIR